MSKPVATMQPTIARLKPCLVRLQAGRSYYWCRCGRSAKQPFCDGSHAGTGFEPMKYVAAADEEVLFCGCKHTGTPPFCDGTHNGLPGGAPLDDPESPENRAIPRVERGPDGRALLNGGCYVWSPSALTLQSRGALEYGELVSAALGAQHLTQLYLRLAAGSSPPMSCGDRRAVLFVRGGRGAVIIAGRRFEVGPTDTVHLRPSEPFLLEAAAGAPLEVFLAATPPGPIEWPATLGDGFDASLPQRVVRVDESQRKAMGPRFFQRLVNGNAGGEVLMQFAGHIPRSKAAPHRHLYEEALIIVRGEGCMWTEDRKADVRPGDVIFLPRKQVHSLEATSPDGMDVVGVIFPGDNPSVNF